MDKCCPIPQHICQGNPVKGMCFTLKEAKHQIDKNQMFCAFKNIRFLLQPNPPKVVKLHIATKIASLPLPKPWKGSFELPKAFIKKDMHKNTPEKSKDQILRSKIEDKRTKSRKPRGNSVRKIPYH